MTSWCKFLQDQHQNKFFMGEAVKTKRQFLFYYYVDASANTLGPIIF